MDSILKWITSVLLVFKSVTPTPITPTPTLLQPEPLTIEKIFSPDKNYNNIPSNQLITVITTGDVVPARSVNFKMTSYNDFTYPFRKTADLLKSADLTLINLEAPLIPDCPLTNSGMIFCGNSRFIEGLTFAGIDVATVGNNHALNYGHDRLTQTVRLLEKNGIVSAGFSPDTLSNLAVKEIKNKKIGTLAYNILDNPDKNIILSEIRSAESEVDFLIVAYHWGAEYTNYPANKTIQLARDSIDNGADFIAGNHPHWIQPIEIYKNKLIIYSHGNFIFDQEWSRQTKTGIIVKSYLFNNKIVDAQFIPILISDYSQPAILTGKDKNDVLHLLRDISRQLEDKNR